MKARTALFAAIVAGLVVGPGSAAQQEGPAQQAGPPSGPGQEEDVELVFRREVFTYPAGFPRRNPFRPLVGEGTQQRFESMNLQGIIFVDENPSRSMALIRGAGGEQGAPAESRYLRVGDSWGNVRVLEIRRDEVLVEVEEFGILEQRIMRLPSRGQGGS